MYLRRTSKDLNFLSFLPPSFCLETNFDKNQNLGKQINSFQTQKSSQRISKEFPKNSQKIHTCEFSNYLHRTQRSKTFSGLFTQKVERMLSKDVRTLKMIPLIIRIFSFYNIQLHFSDSMSLRVIPKVCSSAGLMPSSCRFLVCSALVVGVCIRKQGLGDRKLSPNLVSK